MVAYLSKSDASEGFNQIINFLNGSSIKYALTVNPNTYVSCIKQFWTTVVVKQVNDVTRLQDLVDKKKVLVMEATIREALHLDDEDGVECLPNEEIFAELDRMGYEKPSTKLTFYKAFFSSYLVRNVDSPTKFYMYPRFLQLMIRKQVRDLSTHTTKYTSFTMTQKVFASMKRVGKGFSGVETPLFESMLVEQHVDEEGDANENIEEVNVGDAAEGDVTAAHGEVPTVKKLERRNKVRVLKLRRLQRVGTSHRVETSNETVVDDVSNQGRMIAEMDQDIDVVLEDDKEDDKEVADEAKEGAEDAKVDDKVVTAASETITAASINIIVAEAQVPVATLTAALARVTAAPNRRRKGVVIRDPEEDSTTSTIIPAETKSKDKGKGILVEEPKPLKKKQQIEQDKQYARELQAELNKNINWDEVIDHVKIKAKEDLSVKKYQALKRKTHTKAQARKNMMLYLKNVVGFKMDYFKGMSFDDIRPIFEAKFNSNVAFLLKTKEHIEEDENRALKRLNETLAERAAKRQKLDEEICNRVQEELKRHLHIVPNEDDDVYTEATLLAQKFPVVDYQIIKLNNKPYYKIIRTDDTHQLYVSFLSLLRNFDREDLEALWSLVKEIFSTTKPKTFSNDFLLVTLRALFEKPNIHVQIWKTRRNVHGPTKVKGWKLLESCGVQIITLTSTQLILLVERKYPLTRFTLDQMLNAIILEVKEESEVSLELLRFTRQQHQEGQLE
uniref:Xylulose kinase-1 n=1 Tax=Tanacetum cinerariifolium TaxID=118510 RepID=A0A6L2K4P2_TANCI|nr:xylulose kinase-1 [Tanacetum cinerariifolium]